MSTQRLKYQGKQRGPSEPQRSRLEALGMVWDRLEQAWEAGFRRLEAYKADNGDCLVPKRYETADGFKLGIWVGNQRQKYQGKQGGLSESQQSRLEELGMVWDRLEQAWEASFRQLEAYKAENGDCLVPVTYETEDGFKLGVWVSTQRKKYQGKDGGLGESQRSRLEALGMAWKLR